MYKLLIEDDEGGKTAVSLIRDEITIGRKEGNTIRLTDRNVSRRHAKIVRDDEDVYIEDVKARYGIKRNGKKIDGRAPMAPGDVIEIGDYRLTLKAEQKKADKPKGAGKKSPPEKPTGAGDDDFGDSKREQTQVIQSLAAKLVVISSNFAGEEFPLNQPEVVIGRGDDCDIIIDHRSISSKHAKIVREDNTTYKIVDLNSKNGVKVSGESYRATLLKRGDVVELGHVKFRFVEPGENYVFTPQPKEVAASEIGGDQAGGPDVVKLGLIAAVAGAVVVALAGVFFVVQGDGEEVVDDQGQDTEVAAQDDEQLAEELVEEYAGEGDEDDQIGAVIAQARSEIEAGQLREPIGSLRLVREQLDPSPDQRDDIDDLISQARVEQSHKGNYEDAADYLEDGEVMAAFDALTSIPSHSLFYDLAESEGLREAILEALYALGERAYEEDELEEARGYVDELLLVDHEPAMALADAIGEREEELERIAAEEEAEAQASAEASEPAPQPTPSPSPGLSAEEAQERYTEAARAVTGGDPQRAVDICQEALDAGHTDCHRILGLAHSRLENTSRACSHFQQYLDTGPSNPGAVEGQIDGLGCD